MIKHPDSLGISKAQFHGTRHSIAKQIEVLGVFRLF
jgi:hypothetical protein